MNINDTDFFFITNHRISKNLLKSLSETRIWAKTLSAVYEYMFITSFMHLKLLKIFFIIVLCFVKYCRLWCLNIFLSDKKIALNCDKTAWFWKSANTPRSDWRKSFYFFSIPARIYVNYKRFLPFCLRNFEAQNSIYSLDYKKLIMLLFLSGKQYNYKAFDAYRWRVSRGLKQ